ncbi:eyes absent homolog 2-like isoform X3 [Varroa jacobsoni]|uniref:Eyes absent homolog n=1 Tax=Varroa destructor TaxID=109461 RepID=A0A7M7JI63_VARDE|nr:eyes absent homolog 2-like isoform X3 [Varroa destructor]XP_022702270.1 eyes absent homolog 2-like isoform X3 [Varroa jacobsoni]
MSPMILPPTYRRSPVNTSGVVARTETCEEPLVKTEASSSPSDTIGDFPHPSQILANQLHTQQPNAQSGGNFCNLGSPTNQVELGGYPLLSATADIKWYSDFGCSGPNSMGPQGAHGAEKLPIASSPPSTSSEKSLPSFQDSSPYAAYTNMQATAYGSNSSGGGTYSSPHSNANPFYNNPVHSGYTNLTIGTPYTDQLRTSSSSTKHTSTSTYLAHYPTAFSSPSAATGSTSSAGPQTSSSQSPPSVYSSYPSFPSTTPSQGGAFSQPGPLDYSAYGYSNYYYSGSSQGYPGSGYASALSQLTQAQGNSMATASTYSPITASTITSNDLPYGLSGQASPPLPYNKRNKQAKRTRKVSNNILMQALSVSPEPEQTTERVFIWELDETIVLFQSLIDGQFAMTHRKDMAVAKDCGLKMQELMFRIADGHLFYRELEACEQVNVEDVSSEEQLAVQQQQGGPNNPAMSTLPLPGPICMNGGRPAGIDWMRKLASRYQHIRDVYKDYAGNVGALVAASSVDHSVSGGVSLGVQGAGVEEWLKLRQKIEEITDKWLTHAQMCIQLINQRSNCINVLVSSNQLVLTLTKLLLFGLGEHFPIENVYSSHRIGKESCFERVLNKFGKKCTYIVVGGSKEDESSSKALNLPFWRVSQHSDLEALHYALDLGHL